MIPAAARALAAGAALLALVGSAAGFGRPQGTRPASAPASRPATAPASKPDAAEEPKEESFLAIVGGDVETVTMGRLKGATVLMRGTKIWKVGRDVAIPDGAKRIDASGFRVYPGLVAPRSTGIGVAGFSGGGKVGDRYEPFSLELLAALASGLTSVYQNQHDAVIKVQRTGIENVTVREPAAVRLNFGSGQARFELRERFEKARAYLNDLREHEARKAAGDKDSKEPKKEGVDDTHLKLLRRELPAVFEVDDAGQMLPILDLLDEHRFDAIFSGSLEAWTLAGELSRRGVRCILSPRRREPRDERLSRPNGSSPEAAAILRRHGVEIAFYPPPGFDGGDFVTFDGIAGRDLQTLAMDAAWAIRGGLDEAAALEAITLAPARFFGVDHRIGSIEPGKDGDLILTDGPIFDFRTFVQMTVVNGEIQYEKAKVPLFAKIRPLERPPGEVPARPATRPER